MTADELVNNYIEKLCDECRYTRDPHEHKCLGGGCGCVRCNESKIYGWLVSKGYPEFIKTTREELASIILTYVSERNK